MIKLANILILFTLFSNAACAEDVTAPVAAPQGHVHEQEGGAGESEEEEHLDLMALTYKGRDPFGTSCYLHISGIEEEHDGEHHHDLVAKMGYSLHGETPLDTIVKFQKYNLDTNTYYSMDSVEENTIPVLVSALLKDAEVFDYNKLVEYEQEGLLVQSLRADFDTIDFTSFESALDEVLENNEQFELRKSDLDQLQRIVLKLAHAGHYDAVACSNFELIEMQSVEFELGGDHGDDDHDHDHDH